MIIIPARLQSTRLPNKLLLPLNGVPLIIHTAKKAQNIDDTIVACDDWAILKVCESHKIHAMMTSTLHSSGTDRCAEVARELDLPRNEIVINLQGDEPFLEEGVVDLLIDSMRHTHFMASCYKAVSKAEAVDSNLVKVVVSNDNFALYFSRSVIPFERVDLADSANQSAESNLDSAKNTPPQTPPARGGAFFVSPSLAEGDKGGGSSNSKTTDSSLEYNGHIGIYGFFAWSLEEFCALPKSPLESIEKLEQLRALWHRKEIFMTKVETQSIGIDTEADYKNAQKIMGDL
ncbi:3-deoxy-manno-octulosonate cytidylyltransferase [Helicobacter sp. 23-1045]